MRIYVAGPMAAVEQVRAVQAAVVAAGHGLTLDWTRGPDATMADDNGSRPDVSAAIAVDDLAAVLAAEAVLIVASEHDGRGTNVELGAALARAVQGALHHIVVLGPIHHDSAFLHHPAVSRLPSVHEWLDSLEHQAGEPGRAPSPGD